MEPLARFGADVFVVWDAEDPQTDAFLRGRHRNQPRPLPARAARTPARQQIDFEPIDRAMLDIEKRVQNLDQVRKSAETIKSSSETILERVRIDRECSEKQVGVLRDSDGRSRSICSAKRPRRRSEANSILSRRRPAERVVRRFDHCRVDRLQPLGRGAEQRVVGQAVDLPRHAVGQGVHAPRASSSKIGRSAPASTSACWM